jgi:anti-sigma B factor antagonist
MVKITTRQVGGVIVVEYAGRLTFGEGTNALVDTIETLIYDRPLTREERLGDAELPQGKAVNILLNLGETSYIDSTGISYGLVHSFSRVVNARGHLKLLSLTERVKNVLQLTNVYTVFDVYDNEPEGVRSFS